MYTEVQKSVFSKMLEVASSVLELSYPIVRNKYADLPVCLLEYIESGKKDNIIEVRFDETGTTLSCSFNENNICDRSFLFFDDVTTIDCIIEYLNNSYRYDYLRSRWILPSSFLAIKVTKEDIYITLIKHK